jgi:predicted ester cyclase
VSQENVAVVRRWFEEVWDHRRGEAIDELVDADSVCQTDDGPMTGPAEFRASQYDPFLPAFPDLTVAVEAVVADGDQVVVRWSAAGRHTGAGLGFGPAGEALTFRGISWIHVRARKLREGWQYSDIPAVVRGLAANTQT